MASRDEILAAVRASRPASTERPDVPRTLRSFDARAEYENDFIVASDAAGAHVVKGARANLATLVASAYPVEGRQVSAMDLVDETSVSTLPHSFADTDVFLCEAVIGVAENGALWLPLSRLRHRSALFLATNVIVVLDRARIVRDLHAAYAEIDVAEEGFGIFVAGPSKTADIEQSLVIGAHGAKSLTVLLVD